MPIRGGPHPLSPGLTKKGSVPNEKGHYHSIQIRNSFYERGVTIRPILHGSAVLINLLLFQRLQFYNVIVVVNKLARTRVTNGKDLPALPRRRGCFNDRWGITKTIEIFSVVL